MEQWQRDIKDSIDDVETLEKVLGVPADAVREIVKEYPIRITPHVLKTIKKKGDAIWKQVVPSLSEGEEDLSCASGDPLHEEEDSPVPNLVHRYPDRALLFVTNQCPIYCRFCTRKRFVGSPGTLTPAELKQVIDYISAHTEIRDIILSGGDPLMVVDMLLERVLSALRTIPHLKIIRIGTRVPGSLPSRITENLCLMLKKYHPLYMNLHFNHPDEITPEVATACGRLADAGIPLGSQTVLLDGVNDDPDTMKRLMQNLLSIRVKPYYIYQADLVRGTHHFRTRVEKGLKIISALRGHTSGMAVPHYVIDAPNGGGKVAILPQETLLYMDENEVVVQNYEGKQFQYPQAKQAPAVGARSPRPYSMVPFHTD
ncbi:MAG: KamA family radical SAM protein [Nitrospirae bacterium]|nr:KamA family radical SAM protein [Candidatus Troglogloeales bacterium]